MQNAEERRLFYVAMTRTKNRVYFIAPEKNPSEFLLEIKREYKKVYLRGKWSEEEPIRMGQKKCLICGFPMQLKYKASYGLKLYICTNEPEICSFMTNNLSGRKMSIMKCTECQDGYLIVKYSEKGGYFLGCSNYKTNNTGCNNTVSMRDYYKMMGYAWSENGSRGGSEQEQTYHSKLVSFDILPDSELRSNKPTDRDVTISNTVENLSARENMDSAIDKKKNWEQEILDRTSENEMITDKFPEYKNHNVFQMAETVLQALVHISDKHYFGVSILSGVLRGSRSERIVKYNLDAVAEYNPMAYLSREEMTVVIYWLIGKKYILQTKGKYPVLHITHMGLTYKDHLTPRNMKSLVDALEERIPFEAFTDPFYSESNMAYLRRGVEDLIAGKGVEHDIIEADEEKK